MLLFLEKDFGRSGLRSLFGVLFFLLLALLLLVLLDLELFTLAELSHNLLCPIDKNLLLANLDLKLIAVPQDLSQHFFPAD